MFHSDILITVECLLYSMFRGRCWGNAGRAGGGCRNDLQGDSPFRMCLRFLYGLAAAFFSICCMLSTIESAVVNEVTGDEVCAI